MGEQGRRPEEAGARVGAWWTRGLWACFLLCTQTLVSMTLNFLGLGCLRSEVSLANPGRMKFTLEEKPAGAWSAAGALYVDHEPQQPEVVAWAETDFCRFRSRRCVERIGQVDCKLVRRRQYRALPFNQLAAVLSHGAKNKLYGANPRPRPPKNFSKWHAASCWGQPGNLSIASSVKVRQHLRA